MRRLVRVLVAMGGTIGLWLIDVADLAKGAGVTQLCNGLWCLDSNLLFHLGLYAAVGSVWLLLWLALEAG